MQIAKVSFTGSAQAGRLVQIAAAKSNLKRVTLELGGKSPSIIFNDAHIENAVAMNSQGFLLNSGQICAAGSRVFVQEDIAPAFIEKLRNAFVNLSDVMADPALESTFLGPLADKKQFDHVMSFLEDAKKEKIEVIAGGTRKGDKGSFVEPTILLNPNAKSRVYTDEIFGPVLSVKTFKTEGEVLKMANDTIYGLSGKSPFCCLTTTKTQANSQQRRSTRTTSHVPSASPRNSKAAPSLSTQVTPPCRKPRSAASNRAGMDGSWVWMA